ncbi:MAG: hypothetical protein WAM14_10325 [Candidatus Nitrosopolaris sp.]
MGDRAFKDQCRILHIPICQSHHGFAGFVGRLHRNVYAFFDGTSHHDIIITLIERGYVLIEVGFVKSENVEII